MEFLYSDAGNCTLMDPVSFEQVEISSEAVGPVEKFLQPGMNLPVELFEGNPISIVFPSVVEARIADTAPPSHAGQDSAWKDATLDNGVQIKVPLFIGSGETVRVDVKSTRYLERVRLERKRGA